MVDGMDEKEASDEIKELLCEESEKYEKEYYMKHYYDEVSFFEEFNKEMGTTITNEHVAKSDNIKNNILGSTRGITVEKPFTRNTKIVTATVEPTIEHTKVYITGDIIDQYTRAKIGYTASDGYQYDLNNHRSDFLPPS